MKILITGIHGFVGTNLTRNLCHENEIYGVDIVSPEKEGVIKTFAWKDIDEGNIPDVDAIIHLAGKAHETKDKSKREVYFRINTDLTKKIYDYFLASKAQKFIFFSSIKAAADRVEGDYVDESVEPKPIGPYAESKRFAEEYIVKNEELRIKNGQSTYILRPCMIHGPGNKGNLNLLYGVVRKGIPWPLGAFENRRTFTSIDNLCFIINGLLTKEVESGIYNINDDDAVSTNELIEIICSTIGKKAHIWRVPRGLMEGCAKLGTWLHLPLNEERFRKLTENYVSSNAKIKKALGVEKLPIQTQEGIKLTIQSFDTL